MISCVFVQLAYVSNDWVFALFDNELFPERIKTMNIYFNMYAIISISLRFDVLLAQVNETISVFKDFYYLQEDIK